MRLSDNSIGRLSGRLGHSLFAYGTLQFPEVLEVLLDRVPDLSPTTASGWRVAALPGRVYPGLVSAADSLAHGVLLSGLTAGEWAILDAFEDDEYDLRPLCLPGHLGPISTYVWTAAAEPGDWHASQFAAAHLSQFAARSATWRRSTFPNTQ
ncbi:gamma-glutamylcyclotransferase family protein [Nocardia sp. NPDC049149]|uniref:gamma-glutamylcyclotransferase family protein n=1 Tax=Nocardia sp. NPDC049149 TaxID=3364315 RepID=UPI00371056C4